MLKLDLSGAQVKSKKKEFSKKEVPLFATYKPNLKEIERIAKKYSKYKNIIVAGNGGSVNSLRAYYYALGNKTKKKLFIVDTPDPDYLAQVSKATSSKDTVLFVISKSGTNVTPLQVLFYFLKKKYKAVAITGKKGALRDIATSLKMDTVLHSEIGGRYTSLTETHLVVAKILSLDIAQLLKGGNEMLRQCSPKSKNNPALKLSQVLFELDKKKYSEVFMPIYSFRLIGFTNAIMQVMHESVGKNGKGQTFYALAAPESQHHTNQRFFGGKRNVVGLFLHVDEQHDMKSKVGVPLSLKNIRLRNGKVGDMNNLSYHKALEFEYQGTKREAMRRKIPNITISIKKVNEYHLGKLIALWMYTAVYSSWLRNVNPFNQPHVENAKKISFELIRKYKK